MANRNAQDAKGSACEGRLWAEGNPLEKTQFIEAFEAEKGVVSTPPDESRYEGLAELSLGYLTEFIVGVANQ